MQMEKTLSLKEVQEIVQAIISKMNDDQTFKQLVYHDVEKAIIQTIKEDYSDDVLNRYIEMRRNYENSY